MTEILQNFISHNKNADPSENLSESVLKSSDNLHLNNGFSSDEDVLKRRPKNRVQQFSDSDSDNDKQVSTDPQKITLQSHSTDSEDGLATFKLKPKSRIQRHDSSSDDSKQIGSKLASSSDSENETAVSKPLFPKSRTQDGNSSDSDQEVKNIQQQRMKNKRAKIKDKFKNLKSSRDKVIAENINNVLKEKSFSEESNDEGNSIEKIKLKIKQKMSSIPSICDPDTSDEESVQSKSMPKPKKERKTKLISPKPQRMSAKQAMENMQKIKSESNRMLREKEVSLPYHRPKALSLKDIMSRRRPAVSSDGKSLPIKMNGEQLKQYAQMLEERQKEMKELWQSDTDEENDDNLPENDKLDAPNTEHDVITNNVEPDIDANEQISKETEENSDSNKINTEITVDPDQSDKLFDDLSQSILETTENDSKTIDKEQKNDKEVETNNSITEEQDSENNMTLVFDDSKTSVTEEDTGLESKSDQIVDDDLPAIDKISTVANKTDDAKANTNDTELDSQLISLHFDTEKDDTEKLDTEDFISKVNEEEKPDQDAMEIDAFSDDDVNINDIDDIIENAEIIRDIEDKVQSQVLIRDIPLIVKPTLTGAPGMVIDLDDSNTAPKKSGVELLKERFTFFAKLKTPDEAERQKKQKLKPGNQHLRLKQELEEQMAEQRTLEWEKRLEEEKQQQKELAELRGEGSDDDDDIDRMEAKLEEKEATTEQQPESEEEELVEDDIDMQDKPRKKNPLLENEAEESDSDLKDGVDAADDEMENNDGDDENDDDESSDSDSSESEEEQQPTGKKGRILKAFEDSDEEDKRADDDRKLVGSVDVPSTPSASQDDVLPLAQRQKSASEDLFASQSSSLIPSQKEITQPETQDLDNDPDLGTQTFSILDSTSVPAEQLDDILNGCGKLDATESTQPFVENDLSEIAGVCSGSFSQSIPPLPITQMSQSQALGEDVLAMCTGKFYDNEFVSQANDNNQLPLGDSQEYDSDENSQMTFDNENTSKGETVNNVEDTDLDKIENDIIKETTPENKETLMNTTDDDTQKVKQNAVDDNLKSILDELDDPEFDTPKPNKFFCGAKTQKTEETIPQKDAQIKKKLVIESDDEGTEGIISDKKKKKIKKRKLEKRALQISDDEDELSEQEVEDFESEIEEVDEREVEYDSEENEIQIKPQLQKPSKKKRKGTEFFEQEAELTSEDEWVGSGDEDEAGLDRMEREEGDDETFHQPRLQRELGQIHMREVLDQDKREVRIIQELLFEDGDLGGGGRQRKFKWKNIDGEDETGTSAEFGESQEEEFESEEQWRKQRHERETFLRQMQSTSELDDSLNVSIKRTTIIKANLMSKTMSMLLEENQPTAEKTESVVAEKKSLPSPKKHFSLLQQSYQGSILSRGKGALARLAALATPLADDGAPKGKSAANTGRNFVFAALTPEPPKVVKRKADINLGTPKLVKKMKTEEKQNISKSRLLDQMKM